MTTALLPIGPHDHPEPRTMVWTELELRAIRDYAARCVAAERSWRDAVDDMLTVCHMVASDDPRESINRLINWHVAVALDPAVSSDAAKLVAAERERCALLCEAEHVGASLTADDLVPCDEAYNTALQHAAAAIRQAPAGEKT